ncbi:MAG: thioredoxin domain-containing protein [Thermoanaerobaculia bacterium]|nr:thioredoxin domain-containing protein [Thermoanaerobaculia bacterium]
MKILVMVCAALLAAMVSFADETTAGAPLDPKTDALVRQALPLCEGMKLTQTEWSARMPAGMKAFVLRVESPRHACDGQYLAVSHSGGSFYLGSPWPLDGVEGASLEEKLKNFAWTRMQQNYAAVVDRTRTREGLFRVTLTETTERGKIPLEGLIDPDGRIFFMGNFRSAGSDAAKQRLDSLAKMIEAAPARGAEKPQITVVEFSDFQCPSCKFASGYLDSVLAKHGDTVRYVRLDLPLMQAHPWAFAAAVAGRAVYRQKPDLFWDYKKQVYANQDKLSAFTIDDFARAFAQDHDLDMNRYDADVSSAEIRELILKGVGGAFSNEVRSTPTFMVNGVFVDAGEGGKALEKYIDGLLK